MDRHVVAEASSEYLVFQFGFTEYFDSCVERMVLNVALRSDVIEWSGI